jgi:formate dehydrogenase subunit gamma
MMFVFLGHIYMGTVGVKGALGAMKTGWVDEGWAREHHELWYNDVKAGKIPAQRSGTTPPGGVSATAGTAAQA